MSEEVKTHQQKSRQGVFLGIKIVLYFIKKCFLTKYSTIFIVIPIESNRDIVRIPLITAF